MAPSALERRTAMHHLQLRMGAVMADADGWRLPLHYGDAARESGWLRETVGISDVSPIGKVRVVGEDAALAAAALAPLAVEQKVGSVIEVDSLPGRGGGLLTVCLAPDEFLILTPAGDAQAAVERMRAAGAGCAHAVDVTSGICGMSLAGPATQALLSCITEIDTSPSVMPDMTCVQSRFAGIQGLLLRRDAGSFPIYQLYAGREFGEYLWETLIQSAEEVGGGAVGTEALAGLRDR